MTLRILISGSTGFVGENLISFLKGKGVEIFRLSRKKDGEESIFWDPMKKLIDHKKMENFDAVIHLAGESLAGLWTKKKKEKIYESRVDSTKFLVETFQRLNSFPKMFFCASAIGYYGSRSEEAINESSEAGQGFLAKVCKDWEAASEDLKSHCRVVYFRFGHILGKNGGLFPKMKKAYRMGLGGKLGGGKQYMSWTTIDEVSRIIYFALTNEKVCGPINVVRPNPTTQEEFGKTLSDVLNRPFWFHIPERVLRFFLGKQAKDQIGTGAGSTEFQH